MDDTDLHSRALRQVQARRVSTGDAPHPPIEETVRVAREAQVVIDVAGAESYTLLATPSDELALAAGFLLSEGVIEGMEDVAHLKECDDQPGVIRARLHRSVPRIGDPGRNLLIASSCGACGSEELQERIDALPRVGDALRVEGARLRVASRMLREKQTLFDACGGTHAAGLFDANGRLAAMAEDTGRHHALDKAIGICLLSGRPTAGHFAVLSGRLSMEMVGKCARAGIELIAAVSAPTSLALDVAESCHITLCAFVRQTRATAFTHPHRVIDPVLDAETSGG